VLEKELFDKVGVLAAEEEEVHRRKTGVEEIGVHLMNPSFGSRGYRKGGRPSAMVKGPFSKRGRRNQTNMPR